MPMITTPEIRRYLKAPNNAEVAAEIDLLRVHAVAAIETELARAVDGTNRGAWNGRTYPVIRSVRGGGESYGATTVETTTASAKAALSTFADYSVRLVPLVSSWILDVVVARYNNRNPGATSESGGGVSVSYDGEGLPPAVLRGVHRLRQELD